MLAAAISIFMTACEPPTPGSQSGGIPDYTRSRNFSDWASRVATFNVWGLPVISKDKEARMPAIGRALTQRNLDFVLFQEAWLDKGRNQIFENSNFGFHTEFTVKDTLGSGCMLFANTPFDRRSFRPFQLYGPVLLPDAWAIKGVGMGTATVHDLPVSMFTTHLMAGLPRENKPRVAFTPEWKMEMFEVFAHMVEQTDSDAFVLGGDFNVNINAEEYWFFKKLTSLEGTFLEEFFGDCTFCKDNAYHDSWDRQIDFIFVSPRLKIDKAWVDFKEKITIDGKKRNLSDHYGVVAELSAVVGDTGRNPSQARQNMRDALGELKTDLNGYIDTAKKIDEETQEAIRRGDIQPLGLDDRLCLTCRVKKSFEMLAVYEAALDKTESLTEVEARVRTRLESYFGLFE